MKGTEPTATTTEPELASPLAEAIALYEAALTRAQAGRSTESLLLTLVQRDQVAAALAKSSTIPVMVQRLAALDRSLQGMAPRMASAPWQDWRLALGPPPERWWWWLDKSQIEAKRRPGTAWVLLAGTLIAVTISLAVDVSMRIWAGGTDVLSVIGVVFTVAVGSIPLTGMGSDLAAWTMDKLRLPAHHRGETMFGAAVLALLVALLVRLTVPNLATTFNSQGYALLRAGDLSGAQRAFARAVSLNRNHAAAYYNLAHSFLEIGDHEKARSLYTQALATDSTMAPAYAGLGYVLILEGKPQQATLVLYRGLGLVEDKDTEAALWTNLGWAYLEAGRRLEAETALVQALKLNEREAAAHCALALSIEMRDVAEVPAKAIPHWEDCLRYADAGTARGRDLAALAQAHLPLEVAQ